MLTYQPLVSLWAIGVLLSIVKWRHYSEGNNFKVTMTCQHLHHFVDVDQAVRSELLGAAAWRRSDNNSPTAIMCVMAAIYLQGLSQIWNFFLIVLLRYFYNFRYLEPPTYNQCVCQPFQGNLRNPPHPAGNRRANRRDLLNWATYLLYVSSLALLRKARRSSRS